MLSTNVLGTVSGRLLLRQVIIMSVTSSTAPSLTEEAVFAAFETCFRLTVSKRASPVIVSIAIRALSCIAIAAVEAAPNAQVVANSADEPTYENVAQRLKAAGPASFSFERRADSKEQRLTLHPLRSILLFASCLVRRPETPCRGTRLRRRVRERRPPPPPLERRVPADGA